MCNSYSNGQCLYYGVKVSELNNKCDRGDCMPSIHDVLYDKLIEDRNYKEIRISKDEISNHKNIIIATQTEDPKTNEWVFTFKSISTEPYDFGGTTVKIESVKEINK